MKLMKLFVYGIAVAWAASAIAGHRIEQALYAHINGINGQSIKLYRGDYQDQRLSLAQRLKFLFHEPTITFFDVNNKPIVTEITHKADNMYDFIKTIQSRLGQSPKVCAVDVVAFKAPGYQSIELFDEAGNRVVKTNLYPRALCEGLPLSQKDIEECAPLVSNPDDLKKMPVRHSYWENMKTGKITRVR